MRKSGGSTTSLYPGGLIRHLWWIWTKCWIIYDIAKLLLRQRVSMLLKDAAQTPSHLLLTRNTLRKSPQRPKGSTHRNVSYMMIFTPPFPHLLWHTSVISFPIFHSSFILCLDSTQLCQIVAGRHSSCGPSVHVCVCLFGRVWTCDNKCV